MNIRKAEERDVSRITEIYAHARAFMAENGNATQWSGGYPGEDVIRADIAAGTLHVCEREGKVAAVFAFILGGDPCYAVIDGAWHAARPYGTIHRLASAGRHPGVAAAVITWCLEHCESLRADTHADNKIMQHLLEENGFTKCGIIHVEDGTPRIAYQKMSLTLPLRRD